MAIHKVRLQTLRIAKSDNFERGCAATCCTLWADSVRKVMNLTWISAMKREKIPHKKDWIKERDIVSLPIIYSSLCHKHCALCLESQGYDLTRKRLLETKKTEHEKTTDANNDTHCGHLVCTLYG